MNVGEHHSDSAPSLPSEGRGGVDGLRRAARAGTDIIMDQSRLRSQLDAYYHEVQSIIVRKQNPVSGLLPASTAVTVHGNYRDAWVRDNVYSILSVWGLGLAYRQLDDDRGRGYELEQRTVHLMRGLLRSMMAQAGKVEAFKHSRQPQHSLHAKYDTETGGVVVGDTAWGHLQLDATSLYLLMLAQMIASGLHIIWSIDEVNFVQNLIYYIERAYRTPDYGIWERGAKSNSGSVELNASSVGMAKAALESLSGFNLFGARGGQASVLHVAPDNVAQANLTLTSMLPRESHTKEVDAALLSVVGYPAYAVQDTVLSNKVRSKIVQKLEGKYGLKRFLRDGHQTVLEDEGRLYYEQAELRQFENIESEWPLFFTYLYLNAIMEQDAEAAASYEKKLEFVLVERDGQKLLPELYYVPRQAIDAERARPHSQLRVPNPNVPLVWAQSLYLLARMIRDGLLRTGDIDPLGRRRRKVPRKPVVQLVLLAEDEALQAELAAHGVLTETTDDIAPVVVYLPDEIASAYGQVGRNERLGLTGRAARALKTLMTSRFYILRGKTVVCLASFMLQHEFFLAYDLEFVIARFRSEIAYIYRNWTQPGRPTVTVLLTRHLLDTDRTLFYGFMRKVASGYVDGIPVRRGRMVELIPTACFERIDELHDLELREGALADELHAPLVLARPGKQVPLTPSTERAIDAAADPGPLLARLAETDNPYEQIELLGALERLTSLSTPVTLRGRTRTLGELIDEVYHEAGRLRLWAVVRRAAGMLGKVDGDLALALGAILVRQKNVQVGRAYSDESLITQPIPEHELLAKLNAFCREDVRDRVLTQELLLYLSLLIKGRPELFREILTLRIGHFITLLTSQLMRQHQLSANEAYERLVSQPPSQIQQQLEGILAQYRTIEALPQELEHLSAEAASNVVDWEQDSALDRLEMPSEGWMAWRQHRGVIDRRSSDFYDEVWNIFHHVRSLVIGDRLERRNRMDSHIVVSDMTAGETAFALWLEHLLNKVSASEYRQLNIEALHVLARFFRNNPSLRINDDLALDVMIGHAVRLAYLSRHADRESIYHERKSEAWELFYAISPAETSAHLTSALRHLLMLRAA